MELTVLPPFARPGADNPYLAALDDRVLIFDAVSYTHLDVYKRQES